MSLVVEEGTDMDFIPFPKLHRLTGPVLISEKIDGTNGQVHFNEDGTWYAGSRTRWLSQKEDNFGFYKWVACRSDELFSILGPGTHYGEFWGCGIQRGYNLDHKVFSLFNTSLWTRLDAETQQGLLEIDVSCVPVLAECPWDTELFNTLLAYLKEAGSQAAPGYMNPEGIVLYDTRSRVGYKRTFDYDDTGKGGMRDKHGNILH